jgi:nucleoside-diphosphate-sugar epimerase
MRVAITGAGGFLGAYLAAEIEASGGTVLRVRRDAAGGLVLPDDGARANALVHLAFPTDAADRRARPAATLGAVARGAADAVLVAERLGAAHVVLASTGKVYGFPDALPIADDAPTRPSTQLGELKLVAEGIFSAAARSVGLGATSLRIFNAYGPGQPETFLVPTVLAGIARGALSLGELDHRRDWIHASDVARAFTAVLGDPAAIGQARALNVGSGEARSARELLDLLRRAGATIPPPAVAPAKLRVREPVEERAAAEGLRALGWAPRVALAYGLTDLLRRATLPSPPSPGISA